MKKKKLRPGEFYKDLDEAKQSAGCGCASLAVAFVLLFVVLEAALFVTGSKLHSNEMTSQVTKPNIVSDQNFSKIESGETVDVVVPEAVFCAKLAAVRSNGGLGCKISAEGIFLSGKANFLSWSNMTFQFMPKISDGKLTFELLSVKIGEISAPRVLAVGLSRSVQKAISDNYGDLDSGKLISVYLQDGIMMLQAQK